MADTFKRLHEVFEAEIKQSNAYGARLHAAKSA